MKKKPLIVFYDSYCPLCTKTMEKWCAMDKQQLLIFDSFRNEHVLNTLPYSIEQLEKETYSKPVDASEYYKGVETFTEMNKRIPMLTLTTPVLIALNKVGLATIVYNFVAKRRKIVPVGQCADDQCTINYSNKN
ncbi:thioredoxin [Lysinibacillus alkalisoli]|uniref:Thioredoxin n=1 Tax=Lysinibacillus alkalisoli TaxID=1911548 RepID=A0A917G7C6_9BACI|nr:DCC1-like thiol-disulfide oxidoreductase family protein [Lysinibacillus alkalisoli]GGG26483.1 thioredoxin [Lysinibacillus alkalisoli]